MNILNMTAHTSHARDALDKVVGGVQDALEDFTLQHYLSLAVLGMVFLLILFFCACCCKCLKSATPGR